MGNNISYGLPYRGSKSRIAKKIIDKLPRSESFYDLFAGGCAVSHVALLSGKYKKIVANDLEKTPEFFLKCLKGEMENEKRIFNHNEFMLHRFSDLYCAIVFSYGQDLTSYLYSENNENLKLLISKMLLSDSYSERRKFFVKVVKALKYYIETGGDIDSVAHISNLERLERLRKISIMHTQPQLLNKFVISNKDYKEVEIKDGSVVYCDPPYANTGVYRFRIKHDEFWTYMRHLSKKNYVYISEYNAPADFVSVLDIPLNSLMYNNSKKVIEKLFIYKEGLAISRHFSHDTPPLF